MRPLNLLIIVFTASVISGIAIGLYVDWLNQTDYWYSAPDGNYLVFVSGKVEGGQIFFPLCEHSGGDLHGYWKLAQSVTLPSGIINQTDNFCYGYSKATLKNNIIIALSNP